VRWFFRISNPALIHSSRMALSDEQWAEGRLARRARWSRSGWIPYHNVCKWDVNDLREMGGRWYSFNTFSLAGLFERYIIRHKFRIWSRQKRGQQAQARDRFWGGTKTLGRSKTYLCVCQRRERTKVRHRGDAAWTTLVRRLHSALLLNSNHHS